MGIFRFLKKRKETEYEDFTDMEYEEIPVDMKIQSGDVENMTQFDKSEYIQSLEEGVKALNNNNLQLKEEYKAVSAYLSDIQLIETMQPEEHKKLVTLAKNIHNIKVDRKIYQTTESKISNTRFVAMKKHESEIKDAIIEMQNSERELQMINRDIKMIEAEKFGLREDAKGLVRSQRLVNQVALMCFLSLITVLVIYLLLELFRPELVNDLVFLGIILGMLVLVAIVFGISWRIKYNVKLTELKINKAIALHNKVKIKYVNTSSVIEYNKAKFDVENAYQLGRFYELYLIEKRENERYMKSASELDEAMERYMDILAKLNLYDCQVWQKELKAIIDKKEMVEMRHRLNQRRQKIREQLEVNNQKLDELNNVLAIYKVLE